MKQWIKYAVVVSAFMVMAGFFLPDFKRQVSATELEGDQVLEDTNSWTVEVLYDYNGGKVGEEESSLEVLESNESGGVIIKIPYDFIPQKDNSRFVGWVYNDTLYEIGGENYIEVYEQTDRIVLTARWLEYPSLVLSFQDESDELHRETVYDTGTEKELKPELPTVPTKDGFRFIGWSCSFDGNTYTTTPTFPWDVLSNISEIIFTAQWEWDGNLITSEINSYHLSPGIAYKLAENRNWSVNNDGYSYNGGNTFYVTEEGTYTFQAIVEEK